MDFLSPCLEKHCKERVTNSFHISSELNIIDYFFFLSGVDEANEDDMKNPPSFPFPNPASARLISAQCYQSWSQPPTLSLHSFIFCVNLHVYTKLKDKQKTINYR